MESAESCSLLPIELFVNPYLGSLVVIACIYLFVWGIFIPKCTLYVTFLIKVVCLTYFTFFALHYGDFINFMNCMTLSVAPNGVPSDFQVFFISDFEFFHFIIL